MGGVTFERSTAEPLTLTTRLLNVDANPVDIGLVSRIVARSAVACRRFPLFPGL